MNCPVDISFLVSCAEKLFTVSKLDPKNYKELLLSVYNEDSKSNKATLKFSSEMLIALETYFKKKFRIIQQPGLYYIQIANSLLPINSYKRNQKFSTFTGNPIIGNPIMLSQGENVAHICIEESIEWKIVNGYSPSNDGSKSIFYIGSKKLIK